MTTVPMPVSLSDAHAAELARAKSLLENPSIAARFSGALAAPIDRGMAMLPDGARDVIESAVTQSLNLALKTALFSLGDDARLSRDFAHKVSAAVSGGIGGAFGLGALAVELPVSTVIMLRSIADIARSEGERVSDPASQIACLEVFALGGASRADDAAESGYFAVRAMLARTVTEAARYAAAGSAREGAPALVRLVAQIGSRFSIPVTEKAAAQAVPIIGAAGGALINTLFIDHFQDAARGHFTVRRLERIYDADTVRRAYESLPGADADAAG